MIDELNQDESALFDRLVDGEMSADERQRLLASLDDRPGGWRQCALAFLEAQALRSDFGRYVSPAKPTPVASQVAKADPAQAPRWRATQWLAIAAGLLVAFGLGAMQRGDRSAPTIVDVAPPPIEHLADDVISTEQVAAPSEQLSPSQRQSRDALTFWANDSAGSAQRVQVPLVDAGALGRELGVKFRSGLPDAVREHLRRNGFDVQSTQRYAPLWLEDGGSLVVPVEDTRIVPISPEVY